MKQAHRFVTPDRLLLLVATSLTLLAPFNCPAQDIGAGQLHWAYASYFGTGWYSVGDNRDTYVIRVTPRWNYKDASLSDDADRSIGVYFKFPITAGLEIFQFDDLPGSLDPDNLSSLSVTPGIDIEIPITKRFALRPYAAVGWGSRLNGEESAWTYWAGIRSRYTFKSGNLDWALLNSISYVGYTPNEGAAGDFWPIMIGLEFAYPLGKKKAEKGTWLLYWHGTYTSFENDLDFVSGPGPGIDPITDEWEFAIALGKKEQRIRLWFLKFDRLGLGYRTSSNGELKGIAFIFRSVFDL